MNVGIGVCQGTFGELAQGVRGHLPFLFTLPIDWKSKSEFYPSEQPAVRCTDSSKRKAILACRKTLEFVGIKGGGTLHIQSNLPVGKGMASSSADIVASMRAVANAYNIELAADIISELAADIEATDGVMYPGIVSYNHIHGELIECYDFPGSMRLLGFDTGGVVDTKTFTDGKETYSSIELTQFEKVYEQLSRGLKEKKHVDIFEAATLSARLNQRLLPKPYFDLFEEIADENGWGIVVAHSGTVMGLLMDGHEKNVDWKIKKAVACIQHITGWSPWLFSLGAALLENQNQAF
ncbi:MAG TPA: hypothetical protein VEY51_05060 [Chondromyces sp.]|nr:hypothetical protein [Chondromyces sp.]